MPRSLKFSRLPGSFSICRQPAGSAIPEWAARGGFFSITGTNEEVSVVCQTSQVPVGIQQEAGWTCFRLAGPFPFAETGVLASFIQPLADHAIPIFAISTFDTDCVLVKEPTVDAALRVLRGAGHLLTESGTE